jgi:hypothetical protein
MKKTLILFSLIIFISCAGTAPQDGSYADTFISKNFNRTKHDRLIVLPIQRQGKGVVKGYEYDLDLSDKYSLEFMKLNFTVIDRSQLNLILKEKALDMAGFIDKGNYKELKNLLNADIVLIGSTNVQWVGPKTTYIEDTPFKLEGYYNLNASSLRIIDTETSEVLITSRVDDWKGSASTEIMLSIKSKLEEKKLLD